MGADLILACVMARGYEKIEKRQKAMKKYLKTMKFDLSEWSDFNDIESIREDIKQRIDNFFGCIGYRDVTTINVGYGELIVSGGMSWGDDPSDSYRCLEQFNELPMEILTIGGFGYMDMFDIFMDAYKKKLPNELKEKLNDWKLIEQI